MTIASDEVIDDVEAKKMVDENLILLLDDVKDKVESSNVEKTVHTSSTSSDSSPPLYFRYVFILKTFKKMLCFIVFLCLEK